MFDLKPDAPSEVRGPFQPIATSVPGIEISELFPQLATRMQHAAIVRSVTSPLGEHNLGTHYLLTGYPPTPALEYPVIGSVVAHLDQTPRSLPRAHRRAELSRRRPAAQRQRLPAASRAAVRGRRRSRHSRNFASQGSISIRASMASGSTGGGNTWSRLDDVLAGRGSDGRRTSDRKPFEQAYRLIASPAAKAAFDLTQETDATRNRYGPRTIGQSTLLARRLIEADVPFVTVNYPGWDTHQQLYTRLKEGYTGAQSARRSRSRRSTWPSPRCSTT